MNVVTNQLKEADIEILYKTDLEDDSIKLLEALRQSYATDEGIQLIIVANALDGTSNCDTVKLFKKLCPKHSESQTDDDDSSVDISTGSSSSMELDALADELEKENKNEGKSKKKKSSSARTIYEIWSTDDLGKGYEGCFMLYDNKIVLALPKEALTKVSTSEMIIAGAKKATSARGITTGKLIADNVTDHFDYYEPAQDEEAPPKKTGFIANFIPQKGDKPLEVTRKVVLMLATVTFIVTAVILTKLLFIEPAQVEKNYNDLREIVHPVKVNSDNDDEAPIVKPADPNEPSRFEKLQAINPEIKGWIYIPNTTYIDYPVLEHKGDGDYSQYYLHRDYKGNPSSYGSIFIDYRCTHSYNSKNVILHGHNMDNGQVFHQLLSYANIDFYRSSPIVQFDTPEFDADWKIISVFKTNTLPEQGEFFNYLRGDFDTEADFMDFVYNIMERSIIDTGVTVNEDDQLLTLSTCSYEFTNFRTVIVARRVRRGEESKVETTKAKLNNNAVWPQCYYARNGGTRKELTDFGTACRAGQTPWYDGDYKLDKKDIRKVKVKSEPEPDDDEETEEEREERERREREEEEQREREESERIASEKAESERIASEKAESDRLLKEASERAESERLEREANERAESERLEREASERAESERLESERLESERLESEHIASEQAMQESQPESQPEQTEEPATENNEGE